MNTDRAALFVDVINIFKNISFNYHQKLNYEAYLNKLKENIDVFRAVAYGAAINDEAREFIKCLKSIGFEVKYVQARRINNKPVIKHTDRSMDIALDIIRMVDRLDTVIIGSTNINLIPVCHYLKEKGIKVIIFACNIPLELKAVVDNSWEINEELFEVKEDYEDEEETEE